MNTGLVDRSSEFSAPRPKPSAAKAWLKAIELTSRIEPNPDRLFADIVDDWADRQGDRPVLISDGESLTYRALSERINRYARWALAAGIKRGDTVALLNTKLIGQSLAHCINVAKSDHIILAGELAEPFETARPHLVRVPKVWT